MFYKVFRHFELSSCFLHSLYLLPSSHLSILSIQSLSVSSYLISVFTLLDLLFLSVYCHMSNDCLAQYFCSSTISFHISSFISFTVLFSDQICLFCRIFEKHEMVLVWSQVGQSLLFPCLTNHCDEMISKNWSSQIGFPIIF